MRYNLLLACCPLRVAAFSSPATTAVLQEVVEFPRGHATSTTAICAYGKGSEIYPICNEEPILLSASFPGGELPPPLMDLVESDSSNMSTSNPDSSVTVSYDVNNKQIRTTGRKRRAVRKTLSHILKSAAKASSRRASETTTAIDRTPAVLAALLIGTKCVSLKSIALVLGISAYVIGLASWCAAPKSSGTISVTNISDAHSASDTHSYDYVNMPSLPEKGHVPNLVANPMGVSLTSSRIYRLWLRLGATLGLLLPTLALGLTIVGSEYQPMGVSALIDNAEHIRTSLGDPLFLLCFQAMTEAVSRAALLPLPMRILVPVVYNTVRLSPLHAWAFPAAGATIPTLLRILGVGNLLYWYANLLLFLIPVGVVRYLRSHFFCVEAVEVTVRKGGDASVGLLP
mmetsp:Transcript_6905/g.11535  ORF Transcript_6905/g.11535 Transcript_6905/m.11535 type:complete len:400 (-) Transcript_6905:217-1416(-)